MGKRGPVSAAELQHIASVRIERAGIRPAIVETRPSPPDHLATATRAWWKAIVLEFTFEPYQLRTLQAACESWDRCQQARKALALHGLTYTDAKEMIRARPEVAIERDARTSYLRALRELDLEKVSPPKKDRP